MRIPGRGEPALALKETLVLGPAAVVCGFVVGCSQPGRMPTAALPPDVETQPRMLSRTLPTTPTASSSLEPGVAASLVPPSLSIDPWRPSATPRHWDWIIVHHTASNQGSVESIHSAHLQRRDHNGNRWLGIGYHFVIGNGNGMGDGEIEATFRWRQQLPGAHAGDDSHNQRGIGIALVGNFETAPPTAAQLAAVRRLTAALRLRFGIEREHVLRHADIKATVCPGKYFPMEEISQQRKDSLLGKSVPASGPVRIAAEERIRP